MAEQRVAPGGMVFHVLNRGVARMQLFEKPADYQAFELVLRESVDESPMRICAYALMPNHWHLLVWPESDGELAAFMQRLTVTHVRRWQQNRGYAGLGHVYQGRYKSFPVESDEHFWVVAQYVERNAFRANLVLRAEEWRWSSLWRRCQGTQQEQSLLARWPVEVPPNWVERVNQADDGRELEALRRCVKRGPIRTATVAEGNRETARAGVGLSSGGASAKSRESTVATLKSREAHFGQNCLKSCHNRTCPGFPRELHAWTSTHETLTDHVMAPRNGGGPENADLTGHAVLGRGAFMILYLKIQHERIEAATTTVGCGPTIASGTC